jgi:hypothetical protein|tara:strand:- start:1610 stop:1834 length:225 start_codon:yes stop_codon:yes gene_type:complete
MIRIDDIFGEAVIGEVYDTDWGDEPVLVYSVDQMVETLLLQGKTEEEALLWLEENIFMIYHGEGSPIFITEYHV